MADINLIAPRVPFTYYVDETGVVRSSMLTREGFLFLRQIFNRIGGQTGSSNADLEVLLSSESSFDAAFSEFSKQLNSVQVDQPADNIAQIAELLKVIQDIKSEVQQQGTAEIAEFRKQLNDLYAQIAFSSDPTALISETIKTLALKANLISPSFTTPTLGAALATSINFGDTSLANYKEGSWTPVLTFGTPGDLAVTYSYQFGSYSRVGNRVTINFALSTSAFTFTTASGVLKITGIPFNGETTTRNVSMGTCGFNGITKANYTQFCPTITASNNTFVTLTASGSGQGLTSVLAADTPTGGSIILWGTLTYQV